MFIAMISSIVVRGWYGCNGCVVLLICYFMWLSVDTVTIYVLSVLIIASCLTIIALYSISYHLYSMPCCWYVI